MSRASSRGAAVAPSLLAAIRAASREPPTPSVRWRPEVWEAVRWPELARYGDPDYAARQELLNRLMQECVLAGLVLRPEIVRGLHIPPA